MAAVPATAVPDSSSTSVGRDTDKCTDQVEDSKICSTKSNDHQQQQQTEYEQWLQHGGIMRIRQSCVLISSSTGALVPALPPQPEDGAPASCVLAKHHFQSTQSGGECER